MVRFLIFRAMQYRCMAPSILERRSMRNEIEKKIKQLQSCTLEEYDAMGGHIRNHVMAEQVGGVFIKNTMFFESFESIIVQYVGP